MSEIHHADALIIGGGVAGLSAALTLARDMRVRILLQKHFLRSPLSCNPHPRPRQ